MSSLEAICRALHLHIRDNVQVSSYDIEEHKNHNSHM